GLGMSDGAGPGGRLSVVFFFQAEDGIRDLIVTGVQTCALPIFVAEIGSDRNYEAAFAKLAERRADAVVVAPSEVFAGDADDVVRSEERRVGKEWSARW